jgi:hypothetical protein
MRQKRRRCGTVVAARAGELSLSSSVNQTQGLKIMFRVRLDSLPAPVDRPSRIEPRTPLIQKARPEADSAVAISRTR